MKSKRSISGKPLWAIRISVLSAFFLTVWFAGPRAAEVLAAKFQSPVETSPPVALDRVGFVDRPEWLDGPLLLEVASALSPWLSDDVHILDEPTSRRLRDGLESVPWVERVRIARLFPNQFRLHVDLRRPVLAVHDENDTPLCLVDRHGVMLPFFAMQLPRVRLYRETGPPTIDVLPGRRSDEPRVRAAAEVACEWRDEVAPKVVDCPRLLVVDTTNLGENWAVGPEYPEVRVHLERDDGAEVVFAYGRPVKAALPRVPTTTKAAVLGKVLERHPALAGLVAGDLRFERRWADYLQPRPPGVPDPFGGWSELPRPSEGR